MTNQVMGWQGKEWNGKASISNERHGLAFPSLF